MSIIGLQIANDILDRIREAYNFKSDAELARYLGKDPSTISTWRKRNSVNFNLIFAKCNDLNANYIVHGDMPMFRDEDHTRTGEVIRELQENYSLKNTIDRIEKLGLDPDNKFALLQAFLNILEEKKDR